ncbi:nucleotide exchange factor GrpE [Candidatus Curtissbacteria bacterium RIFCSPHIGHO2_12_FULL_38_9b]|uniref:Protein GrpE n=1 Tax=Candidatus Curtissbacteria bacterium RIFCSPHIGHO2_12_FULL_38_9b TaxID=1797720 RepID=A0A1F5GZP1_9BACT|nr:MAG: nucleotide exchange factor GrpE [Candidatus Curtissbacteria bacterium RIFCSPHIGHO2_12_FULL_38_9b]
MTKSKNSAVENNETKKTKGGEHKEVLLRLDNQLKRALADYHNLEKRIEEERKLLNAFSSAIVIEKFLPVLDNLENAQKHLNDQGLEMVIKQFRDILASEGVAEIQAEGQQFDPNLHEATSVEKGENDNLVVKVIRKGYKLNDKVIRPVQVIVSRNNIDQNAEEKTEKAEELGDFA